MLPGSTCRRRGAPNPDERKTLEFSQRLAPGPTASLRAGHIDRLHIESCACSSLRRRRSLLSLRPAPQPLPQSTFHPRSAGCPHHRPIAAHLRSVPANNPQRAGRAPTPQSLHLTAERRLLLPSVPESSFARASRCIPAILTANSLWDRPLCRSLFVCGHLPANRV